MVTPYLYVYFAISQNYFNEDAFVQSMRCKWEGINHFQLTVHWVQRGPLIQDLQEGYLHLNDNQELLFNYEDYKTEYAYVAYEIPPTGDSNLKYLWELTSNTMS